MRTFHRLLRSAPIGLVLALLLLAGPAAAAPTIPSIPVQVTNDAAHAVPVTLQGTAAVQGTVKVAGDQAPAAAIQAQGTCPQSCTTTGFADVLLFTVPAGKRLVIEHASGFVQLPAGAQALYSLQTAVAGTYLGGAPYPFTPLDHLLGPAAQAGTTFSVSNALRLYADPGTTVIFHVDVETAVSGIEYVFANISGYLVDL
jgi:hypothetical protein